MAVDRRRRRSKLRRLMNLAQIVQSHALSFFHLVVAGPAARLRRRPGDPQHLRPGCGRTRSSPATASGCASSARRSSSGSAASGSTRPGSCPAACDAPLTAETRDRILATIPEALAAIERAIAWYKASLAELGRRGRRRSATSPRSSWAWSTRDGNWRPLRRLAPGRSDADGGTIVDRVDPRTLRRLHRRGGRAVSYLKSPYFKPLGYPDGVYRVGPLARLNVADRMGTPLADAELAEFRGAAGRVPAARSTTTTPG